MAKKEIEILDPPVEVEAQEPSPPEIPQVEEPKDYRVTQWAGKPNYECLSCSYATLDEKKIRAHVAGH